MEREPAAKPSSLSDPNYKIHKIVADNRLLVNEIYRRGPSQLGQMVGFYLFQFIPTKGGVMQ